MDRAPRWRKAGAAPPRSACNWDRQVRAGCRLLSAGTILRDFRPGRWPPACGLPARTLGSRCAGVQVRSGSGIYADLATAPNAAPPRTGTHIECCLCTVAARAGEPVGIPPAWSRARFCRGADPLVDHLPDLLVQLV